MTERKEKERRMKTSILSRPSLPLSLGQEGGEEAEVTITSGGRTSPLLKWQCLPAPSPRRRAHNKNKAAARAGAHRLGPGLPSEPGVRSGTRARTRLSGGSRSGGILDPESPPRAPAEQLRGPPRPSPAPSPECIFAWRGFGEDTPGPRAAAAGD